MIVKVFTQKDDEKEKGLGFNTEDFPELQEEHHHIFYLTELFRAALRELYGDKYRLDILERCEVEQGFSKLFKEEAP